MRLIFDRLVTKRTPSEFCTHVLQHGVLPGIRIHYKHSALKQYLLKQYLKEGRALRTETMINNPQDFASKRGIAQFDALVALGHTINRRLLMVEEISQDCFIALESVRRLAVCRRERNDGLHDRGVAVGVGRLGRVHA